MEELCLTLLLQQCGFGSASAAASISAYLQPSTFASLAVSNTMSYLLLLVFVEFINQVNCLNYLSHCCSMAWDRLLIGFVCQSVCLSCLYAFLRLQFLFDSDESVHSNSGPEG